MAICPNPLNFFRYLCDALKDPSSGVSSDPRVQEVVKHVTAELAKVDTPPKAISTSSSEKPPVAMLIEEVVKSTQNKSCSKTPLATEQSATPIPNEKRDLKKLRELMQNNLREWEKNNKGPVSLDKAISQKKMAKNRELMLEQFGLQAEYNALFKAQQSAARNRAKRDV